MNKKIKIIEIFNIISKHIEVDGNKYNWDTLEHFYNRKDSDREDLLELARKYDTITFLDMIAEVLDDSAEDNTEEIEELEKEQEAIANPKTMLQEIRFYYDSNKMGDKINEIIRYIKRKDKNND